MTSMLGLMPAANVGRLQTSLARVPHLFLILQSELSEAGGMAGGHTEQFRCARAGGTQRVSRTAGAARRLRGHAERDHNCPERGAGKKRHKIDELKAKLAELARTDREELLTLLWEIHASRTLTDAIVRFGQLRHTYVMVGWVPTDDLETLSQRIKYASKKL